VRTAGRPPAGAAVGCTIVVYAFFFLSLYIVLPSAGSGARRSSRAPLPCASGPLQEASVPRRAPDLDACRCPDELCGARVSHWMGQRREYVPAGGVPDAPCRMPICHTSLVHCSRGGVVVEPPMIGFIEASDARVPCRGYSLRRAPPRRSTSTDAPWPLLPRTPPCPAPCLAGACWGGRCVGLWVSLSLSVLFFSPFSVLCRSSVCPLRLCVCVFACWSRLLLAWCLRAA